MKAWVFRQDGQRGSALVATLGIVLILGMVSVGAITAVMNDSTRVHYTEQVTQAAYVASGAMDFFLAKAIPDPKLFKGDNESLLTGTIGAGDYTIAIEQIDTTMALVTATGTFANTSQVVRAYVQTNVWAAAEAFDKAIFSENDVDLNGTVSIEGGSVHSNSDASTGGNVSVDGNLTATGTASGSSGVTGQVLSNQPRIPWPDLDIARYTQIAEDNQHLGTTILTASGNQAVRLSGTYTPPGGVLWVQGDARVNQPTVVNGCLVVRGDLRVNAGNLIQSQRSDVDTPLPAIIVYEGDLTINGHAAANGLVYNGTGTVFLAGTMDVEGAVYSWDEITGRGTATVVYNPEFLKLDDPDSPAGEVARLMALER